MDDVHRFFHSQKGLVAKLCLSRREVVRVLHGIGGVEIDVLHSYRDTLSLEVLETELLLLTLRS